MSYIGNQITGFLGTGSLTVTTSTVAVEGDALFSADGNVVLGDASGDTITINAATASIPNNLNIDSNTLFLDSSNNRVGIGTSSPDRILHLKDTGSIIFQVETSGDADAAGRFLTNTNSAYFGIDDSLDVFKINNGTGLSALNHLCIDTSGNVGINDSTPEAKLTVVEAQDDIAVVKARTTTVNGRASYQIGNDADNWFMGIDGGNSDAFFIADAVGSGDKLTITQGGSVGIGTSSISSLGTGITTLELKGNSASQSDRSGGIRFTRYDGSDGMYIYNADGASYIESRSTYPLLITTNGSERMRVDTTSIKTKIPVEIQSTSYFIGNATNGYRFNNAADTANLLVIKDSGNVGIGTSSPSTFSGYLTVHQKNTSGDAIHLVETDGGVISQIITTDGGGGKVLIGARSNHPTIFTQNDTERLRILSGGGLTFNGDTAAANALDDYEEGEFDIRGTNSGYTLDATFYKAEYTKIGNIVTCVMFINLASATGGSTFFVDLPFTVKSNGTNTANSAVASVMYEDFNVTNGTIDLVLFAGSGGSTARLFQSFDNAGWTAVTTGQLTGNENFYVTITYRTA